MSKPLILNYYDYDATQHDKYMLKENKKVCFKIKCKYCPQHFTLVLVLVVSIPIFWVEPIQLPINTSFFFFI